MSTPEAVNGLNATDIVKVAKGLGKWKTYLIYALLATIAVEAVIIIWQRSDVAVAEKHIVELKRENDRMRVERDIAKANEQTCAANLADQNQRIADAGKEYGKMTGEFDKLREFIVKGLENGTFYRKTEEIKKKPTPKSCQEALDFLNENT